MKIYLLRHAETDHNVKKVIQGSLDTTLNHIGHQQAQCLARRLDHIEPARIFCSDLCRCKETLAHVIPPDSKLAERITYTALLRERYMGELQGITKDEVDKLCRDAGKNKFDFGEGQQKLRERVKTFWEQEILPLYSGQLAHNGGTTEAGKECTVYICSHGGTLLMLTQQLVGTYGFGLDPELGPIRPSPNTAVTILNTITMRVEVFADISHLEQISAGEKDESAKLEVVDV